ncbi:MAG: shikimate dehydrogenase [Caldimonas sp.]|nr:shikimate dehydrogenase [Pseudomonadota bacterium]
MSHGEASEPAHASSADAGAGTDRYAVVGHPVEHSQSPFIHREFARQTGEPIIYERRLCPLDGFAAAVKEFAESGGRGCNVTMPFKFAAFHLATASTARALLAGACNTLLFQGSGWRGDNTDGIGLLCDIEQNAGMALVGARVLLIGAGGGAAGAIGPLLAAGAREIVVANRTVARAQALVARHRTDPSNGSKTILHACNLDACGEGFDIVINASSSSVAGPSIPVSAAVLRPGTLAIDMMYGPPARAFVTWAEGHGATARDGLGMLVEQAAEAFFFWRGVRPRTDGVLATLRRRLDAE